MPIIIKKQFYMENWFCKTYTANISINITRWQFENILHVTYYAIIDAVIIIVNHTASLVFVFLKLQRNLTDDNKM